MTRLWTTLASEPTDEGALELRSRGAKDFLITIAGRVLMTSVSHRSEDALARLACAGLPAGAAVLVSGLGMGFTLRAALDSLDAGAQVVVVELNPVVAGWCRGPLAELTDGALADPRVTLEVDDVSRSIARRAAASAKLDAIVLDMYEGPPAKVAPGDLLYGERAVARCHAALKPGGVLAVWSESVSPGYERILRQSGFRFEVKREGYGGKVHVVYLARAMAAPKAPRRQARG